MWYEYGLENTIDRTSLTFWSKGSRETGWWIQDLEREELPSFMVRVTPAEIKQVSSLVLNCYFPLDAPTKYVANVKFFVMI